MAARTPVGRKGRRYRFKSSELLSAGGDLKNLQSVAGLKFSVRPVASPERFAVMFHKNRSFWKSESLD